MHHPIYKTHFAPMRNGRFIGNTLCGRDLTNKATNVAAEVTCARCNEALASKEERKVASQDAKARRRAESVKDLGAVYKMIDGIRAAQTAMKNSEYITAFDDKNAAGLWKALDAAMLEAMTLLQKA